MVVVAYQTKVFSSRLTLLAYFSSFASCSFYGWVYEDCLPVATHHGSFNADNPSQLNVCSTWWLTSLPIVFVDAARSRCGLGTLSEKYSSSSSQTSKICSWFLLWSLSAHVRSLGLCIVPSVVVHLWEQPHKLYLAMSAFSLSYLHKSVWNEAHLS